MKNYAKVLKTVFVAFALICCLLLFPGCSSDSAWQEPELETTVTETTVPVPEEFGEEDNLPEGAESWEIPPQEEIEDINDILMQDAQEAMQDMYEDYHEGYGNFWGY